MNRSTHRLACALVAGATLLTACSDSADSTDSAESTGPPSARPGSSPSFTLLSEHPGYETPLPAGRYGLTVAEGANPDLPWAVVEAPAGCDHFGTWILDCPEQAGKEPATLAYWALHSVRPDPCVAKSKVVDTVQDAVSALRGQRYSRVSAPSPAGLGGYDATLVELQIPKAAFDACPEFHPWDIDPDGGLPYYQSPGTLSLWIVDIDGDLAVIDVRDRSRLGIALAESLEFVARTE